MQETLLQQGIDLMIYGMGTVIVFLTLLVFATGIMSRFMLRYFPDPVVVEPKKSRAPAANGAAVEPHIQRVIEEAVRQHRQARR
ncbi:OadG family protein [Gilvimarinus agarilyticus]|uniref:OadG family protein n=1 Tax=unclassified Gilvimarinus TaxID=2642066 RepID=UPI001C08CC04|nr:MULTISPECIES: OadG family transporter subunit [unclassified Gilvimarinus]MBU2886826.1 OadG family protein [Gilvimarinus agarilyticus]MDO6571490.1 OadG family transporter subunit [Gilvimarinus sp. 2_MG-2023]MDO6747329.1 OadG family transporter subunit [Gilvimarinus sp. 1_MG-2023]